LARKEKEKGNTSPGATSSSDKREMKKIGERKNKNCREGKKFFPWKKT